MAFTDDRPADQRADEAGQRPVADTVAALSAAETTLAAVDRAIEALDRGTYGTCPACGATIPDGELAADPTTQHCAEHRAPT